MIGKIEAEGWIMGNAVKGEDITFDLPSSSVVEVEYRGPLPALVHAVSSSGEMLFLGEGKVVRLRQRLDGFAGLVVQVRGQYALRVHGVLSSETVDPTLMVHQVLAPVNPEKVALKAMLQEYLEKMRVEGLLKDDVEVMELAEDLAEGDLEFDEPDPFGLTAAAEQEEERQAEAARERWEKERELSGKAPPGKPNAAPPGAASAEEASPGTPA